MKKFVIISLILLTGCTFQTKHRGYVFPSDMESEITGIKTTDQLLDKIGSPQVKTIYGDTVWVYYGADENYRGPLPMTYDNKTVLLAWVKGNPQSEHFWTKNGFRFLKETSSSAADCVILAERVIEK